MKKSYRKIKLFLCLSTSFVLLSTVSANLTSCNLNNGINNVTFNDSKDFEIIGLNNDGYKKGDKVSFSINVTNTNKEIDKVLKDGTSLLIVPTFTFTMPD
jgi:hypothetical protein